MLHEIGYYYLLVYQHSQFIQLARLDISLKSELSDPFSFDWRRRTSTMHFMFSISVDARSSENVVVAPVAAPYKWYSQSYKKNITRHIRTLFNCSSAHVYRRNVCHPKKMPYGIFPRKPLSKVCSTGGDDIKTENVCHTHRHANPYAYNTSWSSVVVLYTPRCCLRCGCGCRDRRGRCASCARGCIVCTFTACCLIRNLYSAHLEMKIISSRNVQFFHKRTASSGSTS